MRVQNCILLIDDDEEEMELFSEALGEINKSMSCIQSTSASAALNLLNNLAPNYIFLDVDMPCINGFKCLEEIKKMKGLCSVPVIMYSNWPTEETFDKAMKAGAAACIKKPMTVQALAKILEEIFQNNVLFKGERNN